VVHCYKSLLIRFNNSIIFLMPVTEILMYIFLFATLFFQVFILLTFLDTRKDLFKKRNFNISKFPSVSIMVPCFNEEKTLAGTINSLLALDYPKEKLAIIVIDDGSTDSTPDVLTQFATNPQVKLYKKENGGKYTALNFGLERITSDLVGCLDADSFVERDALKIVVSYFLNDKSVDAVTPSIIIREPKSIIQKIQRAEYYGSIFLRKMLSYLGAIYVTPGPFSIFRRKVFTDLGNYEHAYNTEDFELALRMHNNSMKIVNAHEARVTTIGPYSARALHKQRLRWTFGFLKNIIDYKHLFGTHNGALGVLVLPSGIIALLTIIFFVSVSLYNITILSINKIIALQAVNWKLSSPSFSFDLFYLNTDASLIIGIVLIFMTIVAFTYGRKIADQKNLLIGEFILFAVLYVFVAPLWIIHSFYNLLLAKSTHWR